MSELPEGWVLTNLGSLANYVNGKGFKKSEWKREGLPIVRIQNLNNPSANFNYADDTHDQKFRINSGDLLVAWSASLGAYIWDRGEAWLNQHIFRVDAFEQLVDHKFLFYIIKNSIEDLYGKTHGMGMVHVTKGKFEGHEIYLPPLNEQKRITNKLDSLLAKVQDTQTRLEKIPGILKRFRKSVLAAATSGELTNEWRIKTNNTWPSSEQRLDSIITLLYGKALPAKVRSGSGFAVYGSNGQVGKHFEKLVDGPFIVVGRKGSYGEITWSEQSGWPIDTTYYVSLKEDVNLRYVYFLLQTLGLNQLNRSTAIPGLNREDAYQTLVAVPTLNEQIEIVSRIESLFSIADKVEQQYKAAKKRTDRLTQSLLAKAFRGELVPQDPSDEPASELLKRIQAERKALGKKKLKKKAKRKSKSQSRQTQVVNLAQVKSRKSSMNKSRFDEDVLNKAYLAGLVSAQRSTVTAQQLFYKSKLPIDDFYKQLAWEIDNKHIVDKGDCLETALCD